MTKQNQLHPKKLLQSKWTAVHIEQKQKHFHITQVSFDEDQNVDECIIEAVLTKKKKHIDWRELKDSNKWIAGWK